MIPLAKHMPYTSVPPGPANTVRILHRDGNLSACVGALEGAVAGAIPVRLAPTSHMVTRTSSAPALVRRNISASASAARLEQPEGLVAMLLPDSSRTPRISSVPLVPAREPPSSAAPQTPRCVPLEQIADSTVPMPSASAVSGCSRISPRASSQPLSARPNGQSASARWSQPRNGIGGASPGMSSAASYPPMLPPNSPMLAPMGPCIRPLPRQSPRAASPASLSAAVPMRGAPNGMLLAQAAGLGWPTSRSLTAPPADTLHAGFGRVAGSRSGSIAMPSGDSLSSSLVLQQCAAGRSSSVPTGQRRECFQWSPPSKQLFQQVGMVSPAEGNPWAWMQPQPSMQRPLL